MQAPRSINPLAQTAVLLLADIASQHRLWGWSRLARGTNALASAPGLVFSKILGSGYEGGFGLKPSASRQGVFALFETPAAADDFLNGSAVVKGYQERANEFFCISLQAWSCRGTWDGQAIEVGTEPQATGPIAALTRASIHVKKANAFWRYAPPSQAALEKVDGCQLAVGLGEAPFLRQATFTVWDSVTHMDAYARSGAHLEAIKAAQQRGYFSESMFARFQPLTMRGVWRGTRYG